MATRGMTRSGDKRTVRIEVWQGSEPPSLLCVHQTILAVGSVGVSVGNHHGGGTKRLKLARGDYPLRVLVDADKPQDVTRVVFAVSKARVPT